MKEWRIFINNINTHQPPIFISSEGNTAVENVRADIYIFILQISALSWIAH